MTSLARKSAFGHGRAGIAQMGSKGEGK